MTASGPLAELYARRIGETERQLQDREHQRRRLAGVVDRGFINLDAAQSGDDEAEVARRAVTIEAAAAEHRDELLRLTVEILTLQDRILYYRQFEALYADGSIPQN